MDFNGGADISSGHIVSSQNQLQLTNRIKGTILISVDGEIQGINNAPNSFFITIRRVDDGATFNADIANRVILGRYQSPVPYGVCCVSANRDVSKFHCCLWRRNDGAVMISDNNSTNHTYINGHRIEADTVLNRGDIIHLGANCKCYKTQTPHNCCLLAIVRCFLYYSQFRTCSDSKLSKRQRTV